MRVHSCVVFKCLGARPALNAIVLHWVPGTTLTCRHALKDSSAARNCWLFGGSVRALGPHVAHDDLLPELSPHFTPDSLTIVIRNASTNAANGIVHVVLLMMPTHCAAIYAHHAINVAQPMTLNSNV